MGQVFLPRGYSMQTGPSEMDLNAMLEKMYPVPRRAPLYPGGLNGLGCMSVEDMVTQCGGSGTSICAPTDSDCVATQAAIVAYAEDLQDSQFPPCIPDGTPCGYVPVATPTLPSTPTNLYPNQAPGAPAGVYLEQSGSYNGQTYYLWSNGAFTSSPTYGQSFIANPYAVGSPITQTNSDPAPANVANPIPVTISTATTPPTTPLIPASNGIPNTATALASSYGAATQSANDSTQTQTTAGNWFTDVSQEIVSGIPNWGLVAAAGLGLFALVGMKK